jgi:non-ribosomal peptide synthase protein (TIGR01720 family)
LRYLSADSEIAESLRLSPDPEVMFTYVGQTGQASDHAMFRLTDYPLGPRRSPRRHRRHLLNVVARVSQDKLQVVWQSSRNVHRLSTIERVANDFLSSLRTLIDGCRR